MTRKILRSILLAVTLVLVASFLVSTVVLYSYFGDVQVKQLKGELSLAAAGTEVFRTDGGTVSAEWTGKDFAVTQTK